jgi:hypothetical protein
MKKLLCMLFVIFVSCTQVARPSKDSTNELLENIRYAKDYRTGLCFAFLESANGSLSMTVSLTCVPCSSIVNELK